MGIVGWVIDQSRRCRVRVCGIGKRSFNPDGDGPVHGSRDHTYTCDQVKGPDFCYLCRDHVHVLVRLHDALDAGQGQVDVVLEILFRPEAQGVHLFW